MILGFQAAESHPTQTMALWKDVRTCNKTLEFQKVNIEMKIYLEIQKALTICITAMTAKNWRHKG